MMNFFKLSASLLISTIIFAESVCAQPSVKVPTTSTQPSKRYTINISDLPEDIKGYVQLISPGKKQIKASDEDLRKALTVMAAAEKKMPGATEKIRRFAQTQGYKAKTGVVFIKCADLLGFVSELLQGMPYEGEIKGKVTSALACSDAKSKKGYPVLEPMITQILTKAQEIENMSRGITQRARDFLRSKYGFQG